jgi:hypothetical protein
MGKTMKTLTMKYLTIIILFFITLSVNAQSWLPDECTAQQPPVALDSAFILLSDSRAGINQCRGEWASLINHGLIRREKITLTHSPFVASSMASLPDMSAIVATTNNVIIHYIAVVANETFGGGSISDVDLDIGIDGSEELYAANIDVFGVEVPHGTIHTNTATLSINEATEIIVTLDVTGGNEGDLTGGSVDLYFYYSILD